MTTTSTPTSTSDLLRTAKVRLAQASEVHDVDMTAVLDVLISATAVAQSLDQVRLPRDDRDKATLQAEAGRQLNRLGDLLEIANAEVKAEYWRLKGYADPRD